MKFKPLPLNLVQVGEVFPFDIYIQLSSEKAVHLYKKNVTLLVEDLVRLEKYPSKKLIIPEEDYKKFFKDNVLTNIKENIMSEGKIDEKKGIEVAKYAFDREEGSTDKEYVDNMIEKSTEIVKGLLDSNKAKADKNSLYNIIVSMEKEDEEFLSHSHQVFAIASMLLLSLPNIEMEYIEDLGYASMLHGYGLHYLSNSKNANLFSKYFKRSNIKIDLERDLDAILDMIKKHFSGHSFKSFDDVGSYLKHFYIIEKVLEHTRFKASRGLKRTILDLKKLETPKRLQVSDSDKNPYLPAKVLYISDHLISEVNFLMSQNKDQNTEDIMKVALRDLKKKENLDDLPHSYDIKIIDHFIEIV